MAFAEPVAVLNDEHVDINFFYSGSSTSFDIAPRDDDNTIQYKNNNVVLNVKPEALTARSASSTFDFIGVGAGQNYYRLPQGQNPLLLYLGCAGYGVTSSTVDSYDASAESGGRATGVGPWVRMRLKSVVGPGHFSIWQSGTTPKVWMASFGGITADDSVWLLAGSHVHFNYGFTLPGQYRLTLVPSAYKNDNNSQTLGQYVEGCPVTIFFRVATNNAVALVRGTVDLQNFEGHDEDQPLEVQVIQGGTVVDEQLIYPRCDGGFSLHTLARGTCDVRIKGKHWLSRKVTGVQITNDGVDGLSFSLPNGDVDNDDVVSVFDYIILSDYFDSTESDPSWLLVGGNGFRPVDADLDGDGTVSVFDYIILSDNFDQAGQS